MSHAVAAADNTVDGPTNHALTRLAHKGGVKILASGVYDDARLVFNLVIDKAVSVACKNAADANRTTISSEDVATTPAADLDAATECIPRTAFKRLIVQRTVNQDVKWSVNALKLLQGYAESFIVNVFQQANMYAHHAGRETVQLKDLQLVGKVRGEW